ncbi:DUF3489 domain-containing protein [Novosphingobium sp. MW5]|nr:DUF3489 domain-containing protein [Novosphingobium sp. MW5]MCW1403979.1 DUF3489 domain-containing protein [Novosphingobium sp. MW5]
MTNTTNPAPAKKPRRMAREPQSGASFDPQPEQPAKTSTKTPSKLDQVEALLRASTGASIAEIMAATGWQQHSVRGAMAGALKKRGLVITSDKAGGTRRYRASAA